MLEDVDVEKLPNLKQVITIRTNFNRAYPSHVKASYWPDLVASFPSDVGEFPAIDESESSFPIRITYEAPGSAGTVGLTKFTHQNVISAIASQIKVLPQSHQWGKSDTVLIFTSELSMFTIVSQFTAFVTYSSLVFLSKMNVAPNELLLVTKPTIIVTDDETTFSLLEQIQDLTVLGVIKQKISEVKLSRGSLPRSAVLAPFSTVRLVYSSTCIFENSKSSSLDPSSDEDHHSLTSSDTNSIRALTGARFVHALTSPLVAGPIASTNVYDYRLNSWHDNERLTNYGPVAACLELVLRDDPTGSGSADKDNGRLFVRGFSASGSENEWVDTGIVGSIGHDGCIKVRN